MKKGGIGVTVSQLDGYLQAVRDMNDDHSGKRYFFWSDMIQCKKESIQSITEKYLNKKNVSIEEIDLKKELEIIESNILDNYLQGSSDSDSNKQNYIKNLHGWRIQEYISLALNYEDPNRRWVTVIKSSEDTLTSIFTKYKNHVIIMNFSK
jgi:hypothetical protein